MSNSSDNVNVPGEGVQRKAGTSTCLKVPPPALSLVTKIIFMWHTPLGDLLKGHVTGAKYYQAAILYSGLPQQAQDTLLKTVRATRLMHKEKLDVAKELVAHFQDALCGRVEVCLPINCSQAQLDEAIQEFGEPSVVAKLIRTNMIRKRPLHVRVSHLVANFAGILVLLFMLWMGVLMVRHIVSTPVINRDFVAEHNAAIQQIPENQRAWPRYKQILPVILMDIASDPAWSTYADATPESAHWPARVAHVQRLQPEIALIREAAKLPTLSAPLLNTGDPDLSIYRKQNNPTWGFVPTTQAPDPSHKPLLSFTSSEFIGDVRGLSRLMASDALLAQHERDGDRFVADVQAMVGLAKQSLDTSMLLHQLSAYSLYHAAATVMGSALAQDAAFLSDSQLRELDAAFASFGPTERVQMDFSGERLSLLDYLQKVYSDNGRGNGIVTAEGMRFLSTNSSFGPSSRTSKGQSAGPGMAFISPIFASRQKMLDKFEEVLRDLDQNFNRPKWEWKAAGRGSPLLDDCENSAITSLRYLWLCVFCPAYMNNYVSAESVTQTRDVMRVAIALARFRLANGAYPSTLEALVPTFIDRIGPDRVDGKPMRYTITSGKPLLYSIGVDRVDDGGRAIRHRDGSVDFSQRWMPAEHAQDILNTYGPQQVPIDGDVILWPQVDTYINDVERAAPQKVNLSKPAQPDVVK